MIDADQQPADGVMLFGTDLADEHRTRQPCQPARPEGEIAHVREQQAQGGVQRDGQHGSDDHREIFGVGQWLEQPAFLGFQCQYRQKRHRDHQQREETRASHFFHGVNHHAVIVLFLARPLPLFQFFVRLFHHHDGGIHHGPHGDCDAAQRHDIRGEAHHADGDKRNQDSDGNSEHGNDGARHVPEKNQNHQRDNRQLFHQRVPQVVDRAQDEFGAVVDGHHTHARREAGCHFFELRFNALNHGQGILALAHHHDS